MNALRRTNSISIDGPPWKATWPANELENLWRCPVCSSGERKLLHDELIDNVFYCASGKWTMWRCSACGSAYLDPRPSTASIHLAYKTYYTHTRTLPGQTDNYAALSSLRKLRRRILNGYINRRYSTRKSPAWAIGAMLFPIAWLYKIDVDRTYRHLPPLPPGGGAILDVGCGGGSFLQIAASLGWNVIGIDPDPAAVANCLGRGLKVLHGGIDQFGGSEGLFDVITLNHVLEHLHDPISVLKACHRLLKLGGQLWLETPNVDSLGHSRYVQNWRGLEPPRHLVLFNNRSLTNTLLASGFTRVERRPSPSPLFWMTKASEAIKQGLAVESDIPLSTAKKWIIRKDALLQGLFPSRKEFLTVVAIKK